ncbi:ankyrin [Ascobolus immersus RN42]|uniref:Ankyrin n=1 Tax=Ascobolus immersus RN42 TaxID=1160509 RepID=A0A3N4I5P0_ASCIM|nr:ankyrin [Ascobolus immersus RN42]
MESLEETMASDGPKISLSALPNEIYMTIADVLPIDSLVTISNLNIPRLSEITKKRVTAVAASDDLSFEDLSALIDLIGYQLSDAQSKQAMSLAVERTKAHFGFRHRVYFVVSPDRFQPRSSKQKKRDEIRFREVLKWLDKGRVEEIEGRVLRYFEEMEWRPQDKYRGGHTDIYLDNLEGNLVTAILHHPRQSTRRLCGEELKNAKVKEHLKRLEWMPILRRHMDKTRWQWHNLTPSPVIPFLYEDDLPMLELFLAHGWNINEPIEQSQRHSRQQVDDSEEQHIRLQLELEASFPVHYAVFNASENCFKWLLRNGADVNVKTASGFTPLHHLLNIYLIDTKIYAPAYSWSEERWSQNERLLRYILQHYGSDPDVLVGPGGNEQAPRLYCFDEEGKVKDEYLGVLSVLEEFSHWKDSIDQMLAEVLGLSEIERPQGGDCTPVKSTYANEHKSCSTLLDLPSGLLARIITFLPVDSLITLVRLHTPRLSATAHSYTLSLVESLSIPTLIPLTYLTNQPSIRIPAEKKLLILAVDHITSFLTPDMIQDNDCIPHQRYYSRDDTDFVQVLLWLDSFGMASRMEKRFRELSSALRSRQQPGRSYDWGTKMWGRFISELLFHPRKDMLSTAEEEARFIQQCAWVEIISRYLSSTYQDWQDLKPSPIIAAVLEDNVPVLNALYKSQKSFNINHLFSWEKNYVPRAINLRDRDHPLVQSCRGMTLALYAAYHPSPRVFRWLVENGANMNLQNLQNDTPLHHLLNHVNSPDQESEPILEDGNAPEEVQKGSEWYKPKYQRNEDRWAERAKLIRYIVKEGGADPNRKPSFDLETPYRSPYECCFDKQGAIVNQDVLIALLESGATPTNLEHGMSIAIERNREPLLRAYLNAGVDANLLVAGRALIHIAVSIAVENFNSSTGWDLKPSVKTVKLLMEYGAEESVKWDDDDGESALKLAARHELRELVEVMSPRMNCEDVDELIERESLWMDVDVEMEN